MCCLRKLLFVLWHVTNVDLIIIFILEFLLFQKKKKNLWPVQHCSCVNSAAIFPIRFASPLWHLHYIFHLENSDQTSINTAPLVSRIHFIFLTNIRERKRETQHNFLQFSAATYHLWAHFWRSTTCFLSMISSSKLFSILPSIT